MRKLLGVLLAFGLMVPACLGADPWRYVHPRAKVLAGIEWRRFAGSALGAEVRKQANLTGMKAMGSLDLVDSVDRVLISSPGRVGAPGKQEASVVVVMSGRFDLAQVRQVLGVQGGVARRYGTVEVLAPKANLGGSSFEMALVDAQTLLLAEPAELRAVLSGERQTSALAAFCQRGRELGVRNDIWVVATVPEGQLADSGNPQMKMLSEVKEVEAGASFRNGFGLLVNLTTGSEDSAKSLAGGLQMLSAMALMQQADQPQMAELGKKLHVAAAGPVVQVTLALDAAEVERSLASLRHSFTPQKAAFAARPVYRGTGVVPLPPPVEAEKPPEKQVARIYGLDEGTKEIPVTKP